MNFEVTNFCEIDKYAIESYCRIHDEDKAKNLGDITAVSADKIQDCNVVVGGSPCFTKNTLVLTWNGYKLLKDIDVGDMVLSHDGKYHPVTDVLYQGAKAIVKVQSPYFSTIYTTENHPFYAKTKLHSKPEWIEVKDLTPSDYIGCYIGFKSERRSNLSEADLYIRGLYLRFGVERLGDGIILKIPNEYREAVHKKLHRLDVSFSVAVPKSADNYMLFNVYFLKNLFTFNMFDLSREDTEILLSGCVDYISENLEIVDTRLDNIYNIAYLFAKCYKKPCKFERNWEQAYVLKLHHTLSDYYVQNDYMWYPIAVTYTKDQKEVFDLTVDDAHSFVVQNCIVHNCVMKGDTLCNLK